MAGHAAAPRPAGHHVAPGVRRARADQAAPGRPHGGAGHRGRPLRQRQRHVRHQDGRQHGADVGHRGAEAPVPAADPVRRGPLVPGLLRAGRGLRPGLAADPRRRGRRRLGARRAEDLDLDRPTAPTGSSCWPAPTRQHRGTGGSPSCWCRWTSPAWWCAPSARPPGRASSTRSSSTAPAPRWRTSSARCNGGWKVAQTLLGYERGDEAATNPILFRAEFDRLVELAREQGRADDPIVRDRLAQLLAEVEIMRFLGLPRADGLPLRRSAGARGVDREAVLERVPPARHRPRARARRLPRPGASGRPPLRGYRTDDPGRPTPPAPGSAATSTRAPARSTPARRRSSGTSSPRRCWGCRRSPARDPARPST